MTANIQVGSTLPAAVHLDGQAAARLPARRRSCARPSRRTSSGRNAGPNAAHSIEELEERLAPIREQGYALQDEEVAAGLRSVSVPVFGRDRLPAAAINIAVSTQRHDVASLRGPLLDRLRATADDISLRLRSA